MLVPIALSSIECSNEPAQTHRPTRLQGYKRFSCSTQLSMIFILLINVKMPTIVGILTFISRINTPTKSLIARKIIILIILALIGSSNQVHAQLS